MSAPLRIAITGVTGRMGAAVVRLARQAAELAVVGGTERAGSPAIGQDVGQAAGQAALGCAVQEDLGQLLRERKAQVVVDFTSAKASVDHARACAQTGAGLIIGSTGLSAAERQEIARAAERIPIVLAPNMSVGVNLVVQLAGQLAGVLGEGYDVEIVEAHHRMKKDAPSGTALRLAEEIAQALGRTSQDFRTARQGQVGERSAKEIGIQAVRGGDVVGEHTVYFLGDGERIELTHRATSRDGFASGALRAARWVHGRAPGLYSMADVLGLQGGGPRNPAPPAKGS